MGGLRLALTLFTVAPLRVERVDRGTARTAMAAAPLVGAFLGFVLACAAIGVRTLGGSPFLAAAVLVALGVTLTRGLHLDGLADTVDGLGSYQSSEKALEIMKKSDIGPFGVAAITLVLVLDTAAATTIVGRPWPVTLSAVVIVLAAGRLGATVACRRGLPPARPDGLGALVAQTLPAPAVIALVLAVAAAAIPVDPWRGPAAVLLAAGAAWWLTAHARRRLGGVTGDVIGAAIELATTTAWLVLATAH